MARATMTTVEKTRTPDSRNATSTLMMTSIMRRSPWPILKSQRGKHVGEGRDEERHRQERIALDYELYETGSAKNEGQPFAPVDESKQRHDRCPRGVLARMNAPSRPVCSGQRVSTA